jgi:transcriptional regulator with XRE-family HTH domain
MALGAEIKRRRKEQGLSLSDLARVAEVSKGYLSQIESEAATRPSAQTLFKIARGLGTSLAELLGEQQAPGSEPELAVPESLREFARQERLPDVDVRMLAAIRYRGRTPRSTQDWRFIYESIKRSTEGR